MPPKPKKERKKERVKVGSVTLPLYPWTDPKTKVENWRWSWKDAQGKWHYGTRVDKAEAIECARARARLIANGRLDLEDLSEREEDLVRQFLALDPTEEDLRKLREWRAAKKLELQVVIDHRHALKVAELHGEESNYLTKVKQWFDKMAQHFAGRVPTEILAGELQQYIEGLTANPKSRSEYRMRVAALWNHARIHEFFDSPEAEKLPAYKKEKKEHISVWQPDEMEKLLRGATREFLPWLCLCGFSGLRSEEVAPPLKPKKQWKDPEVPEYTKRHFRWEWIKRDQKVIDVPPDVSKTGKRRLIDILPVLDEWLDYITPPSEGVICPRLPSKYATPSLGALVGGWRKNDLRHSYGSYRAAVIENLPALAIEMGNSVEKIESNYREAVSKTLASTYFGLTPSEVFRK